MTQIQFYHLLSTPLERALPKLMEKALTGDQRVLVLTESEETCERLNNALWSYDERSFLPHGSAKDPHPEQQPIFLTCTGENPNGASILVVTDGSQPELSEHCTKLLDIFDGHDATALQAARARWKSYKDAGHTVRYIQQQEGGGWKDMTAG